MLSTSHDRVRDTKISKPNGNVAARHPITIRRGGGRLVEGNWANGILRRVGHTDAKGTDAYNDKLSERRASAVRSLLAAIYDIDPARLQALGRGKSELKDKTRPKDGINRRVEIRNVTN